MTEIAWILEFQQAVIALWETGMLQRMLPFYGLIAFCLMLLWVFPGRDN